MKSCGWNTRNCHIWGNWKKVMHMNDDLWFGMMHQWLQYAPAVANKMVFFLKKRMYIQRIQKCLKFYQTVIQLWIIKSSVLVPIHLKPNKKKTDKLVQAAVIANSAVCALQQKSNRKPPTDRKAKLYLSRLIHLQHNHKTTFDKFS